MFFYSLILLIFEIPGNNLQKQEKAAPKRIPPVIPNKSENASVVKKHAIDATSLKIDLKKLHLTLCHALTIKMTAHDEKGILIIKSLKISEKTTIIIAETIPAMLMLFLFLVLPET